MEFVKEHKYSSMHVTLPQESPLATDHDDQQFSETRIWIGNIEKTVPEFLVLKLIQKYGDLDKFDFVYFKTGPDKGKPKGYCFVTYENVSSANKAIKDLNGYSLKGRSLLVRHANLSRSVDQKVHNAHCEPKHSQIAAIEAKLKMMDEDTTSIKNRLISSAPPPPLMSLKVRNPGTASGENQRQSRHKETLRCKPY